MPHSREHRSEAHVGKSPSAQRLDKIGEISVCIILSKAIEKLKIIRQLLPELQREGIESYQPIQTRMTTLQKIIPPEDQESSEVETLKHIQKCRDLTQTTLEKIRQGCRNGEGLLVHLKQVILNENRMYYDNFSLRQENLNLNITINGLKEKINEVKKTSKDTSNYLDKMTQFCLEQAATTVWAQAKTLKNNNKVFQQARLDLNSYRLKEKEDHLAEQKEQHLLEITKEDVINTEITNHLNMVTTSLKNKLEKWTSRYGEEVDALDIAILQLKSKIDEQHEKFATMVQQHAARQELLDVLQAEADERDREQERRVELTKAAYIIQQWWRKIVMLRRVHKTAKESLKRGQKGTPAKKKETPKKKKK